MCCPASPGHVGADTAGVVLSEAPHEQDEIMLAVDVGTNAEIVLGSKARLLACSSPTGPAFEGAQISSRPARGTRRHRAHPHRPRDAGAALQGDRRRSLVGRAGLRGGDRRRPASPASAALASSRPSRKCISPASSTRMALVDGSLAARSPRIESYKRTFNYVIRQPREDGNEPLIRVTQNDVRAIQLGQGRALCRRPAADGQARHRRRWARSVSPAPSAATST